MQLRDRPSGDYDPAVSLFGDDLQGRCKQAVYDKFVQRAGRKLMIRPDYQRVFNPYASERYPLSRVGWLARVTRRYMDNWINVERLVMDVCKDVRLCGALDIMRLSREGRRELFKDVISRIGAESYTEEWNTIAAGIQIDGVIEPSTGITWDANSILSNTLESKVLQHLGRKVAPRELNVLDVGTGSGQTIVSFVKMIERLRVEERLVQDYKDHVHLFVGDVSQKALEYTVLRLAGKLHNMRAKDDIPPFEDVVSIHSNFADLPYNDVVRSNEGRMDIILSGGAICHQTDLLPFFSEMHRLLSPEGVLHAWDWYNGLSFAAPRLRVSVGGERGVVFYIGFGEGKSCTVRADGPENLSDEDFRMIADAKAVNVMYDVSEDEARIVLANFRTLLGILGFVRYSAGERQARNVRVIDEDTYDEEWVDIDDHLTSVFWQRINTRGGFSYFDDFLGPVVPLLDNPAPFEVSAYYLIEGYGDDYSDVMSRAGFSRASDEYFIDVYRACRESVSRSLTDALPTFQIRYTFGKK